MIIKYIKILLIHSFKTKELFRSNEGEIISLKKITDLSSDSIDKSPSKDDVEVVKEDNNENKNEEIKAEVKDKEKGKENSKIANGSFFVVNN